MERAGLGNLTLPEVETVPFREANRLAQNDLSITSMPLPHPHAREYVCSPPCGSHNIPGMRAQAHPSSRSDAPGRGRSERRRRGVTERPRPRSYGAAAADPQWRLEGPSGPHSEGREEGGEGRRRGVCGVCVWGGLRRRPPGRLEGRCEGRG